jgi:TRAP-type C4-dicarboxylate transport system substrate-binding protein
MNLTWIIAHEPKYLFYRVAEDFQRIVNEKSKKIQINIDIVTDDEYNDRYNPETPANRHNLWKFLQNNSVQIAQMQTTSLARQFNKNMHILDMPYLFNTHDQASDILDSEIGENLLNNFEKQSNLKGLAFTYSGGFRLLPINKSVASFDEILGSSIRSGMSHIAQDTIKSLGFEPVPTEIDETSEAVKSGKAIGGEHVAQRLFPDNCDEWIKTIIDTKHSLFLTSIVVNLDWWNSLDKDIQEIFKDAASEAAKNERELSIQDGLKSIENFKNRGVNYIELSNDEINSLKKLVQPVYEKYFNDEYFDSHLLKQIKFFKKD